jgi:hypothetical protein
MAVGKISRAERIVAQMISSDWLDIAGCDLDVGIVTVRSSLLQLAALGRLMARPGKKSISATSSNQGVEG